MAPTLMTSATSRPAGNLPAEVDSLKASLWYRGLTCDAGSLGYGAAWQRKTNKIAFE